MFDDSLASAGPARRPWTFAASLAVQASAVAAAAIVSIAVAPALPLSGWTNVLLTPPPPMGRPDPPPVATSAPPPERFTEMVQPTRIPDEVHLITDDPEDFPAVSAPVPGVVGAPTGGVEGGVLNAIVTGAPPVIAPPPAPAPRPEPRPVEPTGPVAVPSSLQAARLIRRVDPQYPPLAKQARVQGVVKLQAVIAVDGTIVRLQATSGHPLLIPAAVAAVKQWRYQPTVLGGKAVEVATQIDVHFRLN